jgi:hypothetical protein
MACYIVGIDPGRQGAVAWIDQSNQLLGIDEAGSADESTPIRLFKLFQGAALVVVERPLAFPGVPAQSLMTLTESYGAAVALARAAGVRVITPTASTWKRAVGVTADKSTSKMLAAELYGVPERTRHDLCEACLLSYYGYIKSAGHRCI